MKLKFLVLFVLTLLSTAALADVKDSAANGFTITSTFTTKGSPAEVYRKILAVGDWWSSDHTYSGDAHNLTLDSRAGGCWCEKLPKTGASVMHMQVATVVPGALLVLNGALGPLQQMGITGAMTFKLSAAEGGTKVEFTYAASGYYPQGMNVLAPMVDKVLMEGITRLRNYVDFGDAALKK
jgi:uncharacterized protein YndB with AHSA1/START domain